MRALVVINPIAGTRRTRTVGACTDLATSILSAHGYDTDVRVTGGPNDAYRFAREGVESRADLVIAWGGDGTVNGAASGVAESGIPFAIVPGGSGNGLARDLSIPFDPAAAFEIAASGRPRAIDAGDLHGSLFFNVAGIGFDARIAGRLATPGARGAMLGYLIATVERAACLSSWKLFDSQRVLTSRPRAHGDIVDTPGVVHRAGEFTSIRKRRTEIRTLGRWPG